MKGLGILLLVLLVIVLAPFVILWAIQTIAPGVGVVFTVKTWLAAFVLFGIIRVRVTRNRR